MCQIHSVAYVVLQAIFEYAIEISVANMLKYKIGQVGNPASYFFW